MRWQRYSDRRISHLAITTRSTHRQQQHGCNKRAHLRGNEQGGGSGWRQQLKREQVFLALLLLIVIMVSIYYAIIIINKNATSLSHLPKSSVASQIAIISVLSTLLTPPYWHPGVRTANDRREMSLFRRRREGVVSPSRRHSRRHRICLLMPVADRECGILIPKRTSCSHQGVGVTFDG